MTQWARLKTDVNCHLRRGAWYRVLKLTAREAVVEVKGQQMSVERTLVELAPEPRHLWTVVPSPKNAPRFPPTWGPRYAVCPNCKDRAQIEGEPQSMRCRRCNGLFDVAWTEPYLHTA